MPSSSPRCSLRSNVPISIREAARSGGVLTSPWSHTRGLSPTGRRGTAVAGLVRGLIDALYVGSDICQARHAWLLWLTRRCSDGSDTMGHSVQALVISEAAAPIASTELTDTRPIPIGQGLRLHTLGRIDDQQGPFARGK